MKLIFTKRTIERLEKVTKKAQELNNFKLFKISKSLLMVAKGTSMFTIAAFFHISERTIYNWILRFVYERFLWLDGLHYRGRGAKSKLTNKQKEELCKILIDGPEKNGFYCGVWNSAMTHKSISCEMLKSQ